MTGEQAPGGWRELHDFWAEPIRAEPLGLFRILLGLTLLGSLATGIGPRLVRYCGPDALLPAGAGDDWLRRTGRFCLLRGPVGIPWLEGALSPKQADAWARWGARPSSVYLLFGLFVAAVAALTVGLWTRLAALAALLLANTFHNRVPEVLNGGDALFRNGLYFLVLAPAGAAWSVDGWLRRRRAVRRARAAGLPPPEPAPVWIAPWSVRLMQIQLCMMYLFTGLAKLGDAKRVGWWYSGDWVDGQAMYWVLNDIAICRWPFAALPLPLLVCRLLSWGTLLFELGFVFFVLFTPLRRWLLLAGVGLHLGILAVMEVGWFSQVTLCWYVLFLPGEKVAGFFSRLWRARSLTAVEGAPS
jgi:hypothetical protein